MAVSYNKLFDILIEKDISQVQLQNQVGYSSNKTMRLKRSGYVSLETIEKKCTKLECGVDNILIFLLEELK